MSQPENPYISPAMPPMPAGSAKPFDGELEYLGMFRYVMTNPNWMLNVFYATVCQFVPIAGPLVLLGYVFETTEGLVRDPRRPYPDFDFNRLGPYFMRGLWPFLVALVVSLVLLPILGIAALVFVMGPMMLLGNAQGDSAEILFIVLMVVGGILVMGLIVVLQTIMLPLVLTAGLSQDFGAAMDFGRMRDFLGRVWKEILLLQVVFMFVAMLLSLVGMCALIVGAYFANAFCTLAAAHLYYQVYAIYLQRGGKPIPLKVEAKPVY